jgi:O-acetyl-ADP-ribose deacetylase (regulator of RNase III)
MAMEMRTMTMTQGERRAWLIEALLAERGDLTNVVVPADADEQRSLLRALFNVRPPERVSDEFLEVQDAYLRERARERGIVRLCDLDPVCPGVYLWQGDITTLAADAIVNAANSRLLGCFVPGHHCIDNAIHSFAGVQLRLACAKIMRDQGHDEPTGSAKLTSGFNLPARHVIHTVGPIVYGARPTARDELALRSCYRSCLEAADEARCSSVALCCVSTGVFRYPNEEAAQVAVEAVRDYRDSTGSHLQVVFNVFLDKDEAIYRSLLA